MLESIIRNSTTTKIAFATIGSDLANSTVNHLPNSQSKLLPPRYDEPKKYAVELNKAIGEFLKG